MPSSTVHKSRVVIKPLARNAACENCRMRKIRCSGDRSGCEACQKLAKGGDVSQICIFPPERIPSARKRINGDDKSGQTLKTPPNSRQRRGSSAGTSNSDISTPASSVGSAADFEYLISQSPSLTPTSTFPSTATNSPSLGYSDYLIHQSPIGQNSPYPISLYDPSGQRQPLEPEMSPPSSYVESMDHQQLLALQQYYAYQLQNSPSAKFESQEEYRQLIEALVLQQYRQRSDP